MQAVDQYCIHLENFEGPYDLLLYLIRHNEIDIYEIQISSILEQYMDYLEELKAQVVNLDEIAEFFVVAATLMRIKARALLPYSEEISQEEDYLQEITSRRQLIEKLLAYQNFKFAAQYLDERKREYVPLEKFSSYEHTYRKDLDESNITVANLVKAFQKYLLYFEENDYVIETAEFKIESYSDQIMEMLQEKKEVLFSDYALNSESKVELIAKFLAILDLTKEGAIHCRQEKNFNEIYLKLSMS